MKVLIVEDDKNQLELLSDFIRKKGHSEVSSENPEEAIDLISKSFFDLVISDFKLPRMNGGELLKQIKRINPLTEVIIVTAYGTIEDAVDCLKSGAYDYIQKPIDLVKLSKMIENIELKNKLQEENTKLRSKLSEKYSFDTIISQSEEMKRVMSTAIKVANTNVPVLILGESGTGKELIARAIHFASQRADKPFVIVNCSALPETLFESELFGYEKGAFTGADKQRIGRFEEANGGTLFIDEIGDIPPPMQVKLLRALQFSEIQRLGSNKTLKVDVRIISATNQNIQQLVTEGKFREDLFYRINVVTLNLPPLRQRKEDIPLLVTYFLQKYANIYHLPQKKISREALQKLIYYDFPGNIRELENIIQRAIILSSSKVIEEKDIELIGRSSNTSFKYKNIDIPLTDLNFFIEEIERRMIEKALMETLGNQTKAAQILNISERTLRYKIRKYGIK